MKKRKSIALLLVMIMALNFLTGCQADKKEEAKIEEAGSSQDQAGDQKLRQVKTDVLVVGGGGTGLVAALKAAEDGASVILVEKQGVYGGATSMSSGKIPAFGSKEQEAEKIKDSKEAMLTDIYRAGEYTQNYELLERAVDQSNDVKEWMEQFGIKWNLETDMIYYGQSEYRIHVAEGGGGQLVNKLVEAVEAHPNIISLTQVTGLDLISEDGQVKGLVAEYNGEKFNILSDSTILATSGFGANREMVEKYIPSIKNAVINVAPGASGEGIKWGEKLGAGLAAMSAYQAYAPISYKTHKSLGAAFLNNGGILLNKDGRRFIDEYVGYSPLGTAIVNQPDAFAYMIWDENIQKLDIPSLKAMEDDELIKAKTLDELASKLGIDQKQMEKEFNLYLEGIKNGEDYMNRTKLPKEFKAPFYAIKVTGDFRHTQGGLIVDPQTAQVLKEDKTAIANLYAGGGVIEGFSSNGDANYMAGNGLLQAFVYGRIAGESAAANSEKKNLKNLEEERKTLEDFMEENEKDIEKSSKKYKDGSYEASSKGNNGDLKVKVTVENEEIKNVEVLDHLETEGLADKALEEIPKRIIKANSTENIDSIAGATNTSQAIIDAVNEALK